MRLLITLRPGQIPCTIPFAYAHSLAAVIYGFLQRSSHDYARFLHDEGYRSGTKRFKLFTFSQLLIKERAVTPQGLLCQSEELCWQISSPICEFVEHLAQGLLSFPQISLGQQAFFVERVAVLPVPKFTETLHVRCLSPVVASVAQLRDGQMQAHYLRADDPRLAVALRENLIRKFLVVYGRRPSWSEFSLEFDREYLRRKGEGIYRVVDYKGTRIKAIMAPFRVWGSPELIAMGYEAGFGEKNSMGFGMVEAVQDDTN